MSGPAGFVLGLALTVLLLGAVLLVLRLPLGRVLAELSGADRRSAFWMRLSILALVVATLLFGLLGFWAGQVLRADAATVEAVFWSAVGMARAALVALLLGLLVIAALVIESIVATARHDA